MSIGQHDLNHAAGIQIQFQNANVRHVHRVLQSVVGMLCLDRMNVLRSSFVVTSTLQFCCCACSDQHNEFTLAVFGFSLSDVWYQTTSSIGQRDTRWQYMKACYWSSLDHHTM
jgi:hypothetical protein